MSTTSTRGPGTAPAGDAGRPEESPGYGWMIFAGTMLALVGSLNAVYGIAAISNSRFYVRDASYVIGDLNTWGWFLLCVGVLQVGAALSIWAQTGWGRWVGVATAGVNAILQLLVIPGHPFLAVTLFTLDILVIYGLVAYGGRVRD